MRSNFSSIKENRLLRFEQAQNAEVADVQKVLIEGNKLESPEAIQKVRDLKVDSAVNDAQKAREAIAKSLTDVAKGEYDYLLKKYADEGGAAMTHAYNEVQEDFRAAGYSALMRNGEWFVTPTVQSEMRPMSAERVQQKVKEAREKQPTVLTAEQLSTIPEGDREAFQKTYNELPPAMQEIVRDVLTDTEQMSALLSLAKKFGGLRGLADEIKRGSPKEGEPSREIPLNPAEQEMLERFSKAASAPEAPVPDKDETKESVGEKKKGELSKEEQQEIKTEAEASVKDLDPTKMSQQDIDLTIARIMKGYGASAHVEGNKFVVDPPKDAMERSWNKLFGLLSSIVVLAQRLFGKKEAAPAPSTAPADGGPKPPESAPQQSETPEQQIASRVQLLNENPRNYFMKMELSTTTVDGKPRQDLLLTRKDKPQFDESFAKKLQDAGVQINLDKRESGKVEGIDPQKLDAIVKVCEASYRKLYPAAEEAAKTPGTWVTDAKNPTMEYISKNGTLVVQSIDGKNCQKFDVTAGQWKPLEADQYFDATSGRFLKIPEKSFYDKESRSWIVMAKEQLDRREQSGIEKLKALPSGLTREDYGDHHIVGLSYTDTDFEVRFNRSNGRWQWSEEDSGKWHDSSESTQSIGWWETAHTEAETVRKVLEEANNESLNATVIAAKKTETKAG